LNQVGSGIPNETILKLWKEVLNDMYGEDNSRKKEIYDIALADEKISKKAKEWLKTLREISKNK
jgi:translation elongation factor EF-4